MEVHAALAVSFKVKKLAAVVIVANKDIFVAPALVNFSGQSHLVYL